MSLYLDLVPKDPLENVKWRAHWRQRAESDPLVQHKFRQAAFDDVLFFFNALAWCFEPRHVVKVKPFVTWPHQDPVILALDKSIDESAGAQEPMDVVIDKSRGQGATWMYLMVILRRWLRDRMFSAGLVTRNESLVDSSRDPDTLMWKIVWAFMRLPRWLWPAGFSMRLHRSLSDHSLYNPELDSTIVGYSATGNVARGGRKTVFGMDEFATFEAGTDYAALNATQHVTRCRWLVSTYLGDSGAYYDAARKEGNAKKLILDWKDNPTQNKDLYRIVRGQIFKVNGRFSREEYEYLQRQHAQLRRRGYVLEGKTRNRWYNSECLRPGTTPRGIAQELDRDPHGSVSKVFAAEVLNRAKAHFARQAGVRGRFVFDTETADPIQPYIVPSEHGELSVWCNLDMRGKPPFGRYVIGADIGGGTGGSFTANSVASVLDKMTGEQVAEWVSNTTEPRRFAYVCVALARWFHDASLIPEANFGGGYMKVLEDELCYANLWLRESEISGLKKLTKKAGFWMANDQVKLALFEGLQAAISTESYIPRSVEMLDECNEYEWKGGKIIHIGSTKTDDEGAKGKAHSDRVIAASLAVYEMNETCGYASREDRAEDEVLPANVPKGSMAERLRDYDEANSQSGDPWEKPDLDIFGRGCATIRGDGWR